MKRVSAVVGILLLETAIGVGCGKKDKEKPKDRPKAEQPRQPKAKTPPAAPPKAGMPENTVSVFVSHEVEDWDKWKKVFDSHTDARKGASAIWHSVSRDAENENKIYIHIVGTDMAKATAFLESEDLNKAMKEAGVKAPPEIWVANDVEIRSPEGKVEGETFSIIGRHEVEDYDKFKAAYDAGEPGRKEMTILGGSLSRAADNENMIIFHFMVTDPAKFKAAMESDEMKKLMKEAGVKGPPELSVAKDVEVSMYR